MDLSSSTKLHLANCIFLALWKLWLEFNWIILQLWYWDCNNQIISIVFIIVIVENTNTIFLWVDNFLDWSIVANQMEHWGKNSLKKVKLWHVCYYQVHIMVIFPWALILSVGFNWNIFQGCSIFYSPEALVPAEEWLWESFHLKKFFKRLGVVLDFDIIYYLIIVVWVWVFFEKIISINQFFFSNIFK